MKKLLSIVLALVMVFGLCSTAFAVEQQTTVPEGYIGIYTAEDLNNIRNDLSGKYILMNDIDLSVYENWEPIGTMDAPFTGELDGNGYVIKNMTIKEEYNSEGRFLFGLFAATSNAFFNKLAVIDAEIDVSWSGEEIVSSYCFIGLISGYQDKCETTNCLTGGKIKTAGFSNFNIGGIVGVTANNSELKACSNYANIEVINKSNARNTFLGGIIGSCSTTGGSMEVCNYGKIVLNETAESENSKIYVGGVFGKLNFSLLTARNYYNRGNIEINSSSKKTYIGGIAGTSVVTLNSYNTGDIDISEKFEGYVANIVGNFFTSALMPVPGAFDYDRIENAYYISNDLEAGYCEGETYDEINESTRDYRFVNVKSVSVEEMKNQNTFAAFDFENVWTMEENGYPVLKNQPVINVKENIELTEGDVYSDKLIESEWTTSNADVATVNPNGEIVAVNAGVATITVNHGYGYTEEITVTVAEKPADDPEPTPNPEPNKCFLANLWIVKVIKQFIEIVTDIILDLILLIVQ